MPVHFSTESTACHAVSRPAGGAGGFGGGGGGGEGGGRGGGLGGGGDGGLHTGFRHPQTTCQYTECAALQQTLY
jgi:hypothetical protein